jgi:hypothetical protein
VLNLGAGSITTQFHVVFDDLFTTVPSIARENEAPEHWADMCLENSTHLRLDSPAEHLNDEWLTAEELEIKRRRQNRDEISRETTEQGYGASSVLHTERVTGATEVPSNTPTSNDHTEDTSNRNSTIIIYNMMTPTPEIEGEVSQTEGVTTPSGGGELRRSTLSTAGKFQTARYADVFLARVEDYENQSNYSQMAYLSELQADWYEGTVNISDTRVYAPKKTRDSDIPHFHEAMHGDHQEQYLEAMKIEIASLFQQRTWKSTLRSEAPHVLKLTWVFKLKRLPDGTPSKFKARFCVRGDLQKEGVDFFETYDPVCQWSTVIMILTIGIQNGWATKQVDYKNAFSQAEMKETVYIEPPTLFGPKSGKDLVILLLVMLIFR